jgi:outer membrane receptor protein involved in Fe transport
VINHTDMYEAGYKFSRGFGDLYLTLFDTEYHNYGVGETIYNNATQTYVSQTYFADTRDYGLEFDGVLRPVHWFDLAFTGTVQNPTFTSLKYTVLNGGTLQTIDYNGNQLLRVPKNSFSVSPTLHLLDDRLMAQTTVEYYSDRFADAANSQLLPAYTVVNFNARYKISKDLTFYLSGYNLTNAIGLTEGNPRAGEVQSSQAGQPVFLARPVVGRNFRMSLLYKF